MAVKVRVPLFDANITEGVLSGWRQEVGESVERGDVLVDLVTDKANFEIESPASGTVLAVIAEEKSTVPVGYVIALVGEPGQALPDVTQENRTILAEHLKKSAVAPRPAKASTPSPTGASVERVRATPKARKLARQLGIDIAEVAKVSSGVRVTEQDVIDYSEKRKPE